MGLILAVLDAPGTGGDWTVRMLELNVGVLTRFETG
jgi:hypothetical protein